MSSFPIVLNSSNAILTNGYYNTFQYNFINGFFTVSKDSEMTLTQFTLPYSWFNVNSTFYNNASFQYNWTVGTTVSTFTITLPNGYYSISDINNYLQLKMIDNGHYLINASGQNVYYLNISLNTTYYSNMIISYPVPTSLPTGYSQPSNFAGYPTTTKTPQFIVLNNNFGSIIGYSAGSYPPVAQSTNYSTIGNIVPNGAPVNSVIVRCSLVFNPVSSTTDILDSFAITSSFGSNINYSPPFEKAVKIRAGKYSQLTITLFDQSLNPLPNQDPNVLINLLIKMKE
jgi:hypothetical protein